VFRNRWHLTNADKRKYGFTTAGFKQLIYSTSGPKWDQSGTAQAAASIWAPDGKLKSQYRSQLINILDSSPDSADCHGLIDAFSISNRVYDARPRDESLDTTSGALWFYSTGSSNPIPENPFKLGYGIFPSAIVPVSFSASRSVSWIFYRLVDGWSY
jgi:hypothetical protein